MMEKAITYIDINMDVDIMWSILDEINLPQVEATALSLGNNGALWIGITQQSTCHTCHLMKKGVYYLTWCKRDLILMKHMLTYNNWTALMMASPKKNKKTIVSSTSFIITKYATCIEKHRHSNKKPSHTNENSKP